MLWQPRADHEQKHELGDVTISQGLDATRPITEVLLRHERVWCGGLRKWVAQHGHRSRLWARATVSLRRMVAMEFGTCRSGRIGGAAGSITGGKGNRLALPAGRA